MNRQTPIELPEGYLDFYMNLESWENEQEIILKRNCSFIKHDIHELLPVMKANKLSLLQVTGINIKPEQYKEVFCKFLSVLKHLRPETSLVVDKLFNSIYYLNFNIILKKIIKDDEVYFSKLASIINVPDDLFIFILDHSIRPFLRIYAAPYQEELMNNGFEPRDFLMICPVCGAKSNFSRLRVSDGRRFMFCDRCFTEWETKYLQCVRCGNDEPGTILYITLEHDEAYQLYYCEKCKGYLKTYDERQTERAVDLYIANVETIYLDIIAKAKGYSNHYCDLMSN